MLNAAVPRPTATSRRLAWPPRMKARHESRNDGRACWRYDLLPRCGSRASCFHSATTFNTIVSKAAPWITWISLTWLKSASSAPKPSALMTMPTISIT